MVTIIKLIVRFIIFMLDIVTPDDAEIRKHSGLITVIVVITILLAVFAGVLWSIRDYL